MSRPTRRLGRSSHVACELGVKLNFNCDLVAGTRRKRGEGTGKQKQSADRVNSTCNRGPAVVRLVVLVDRGLRLTARNFSRPFAYSCLACVHRLASPDRRHPGSAAMRSRVLWALHVRSSRNPGSIDCARGPIVLHQPVWVRLCDAGDRPEAHADRSWFELSNLGVAVRPGTFCMLPSPGISVPHHEPHQEHECSRLSRSCDSPGNPRRPPRHFGSHRRAALGQTPMEWSFGNNGSE